MRPNHARCLAPLAVLLAAGAARAQCSSQTLTAFDKQPNDALGWRVAFQTDNLVASAPFCDNPLGQDTGAVYTWFLDINGAWVQGPKVTPLPGLSTPHDRFGNTMSLDADILVVGTTEGLVPNGAGPSGSVFVYSRSGFGWTFRQRLVSDDLAPEDGFSLGLTNRSATIWAGAPGCDLPGAADAGAVYRFGTSGIGNPWTQQQKLTHAVQAGAAFGSAVATDGSILVVGAPMYDQPGMPDAGAAFVFKSVSGSWQFVQALTPADPTAGARFGSSVAVYGTRAAVGCEPANAPAFDPGMYVFAFDGAAWNQEAKLVGGPEGVAGQAVAIDVFNAMTSGIGFVNGNPVTTHRFFRRDGSTWVREGRITLPLGSAFGGLINSGDISDGHYIIGNPNLHPGNVSFAGGVMTRPIDLHTGSDDISQARPFANYFQGCTTVATPDGQASCGNSNTTPDVWYKHTAPSTGAVEFSTYEPVLGFDTVLSLYSSPVGDLAHQIACNDDFTPPQRWSKVSTFMRAGETVWIRVSGYNGATGDFTLRATQPCYANCDASLASPSLNVNDFSCFMNRYAAGDPLANCDGSTAPPILNINDFTCFLNKFAAGCP
ncbi:MAG: FG-GAP repeat protein [Phycisphaerae bacterium]|nr:FG-GAP repeat protein [Phycisphaerae bacterium]